MISGLKRLIFVLTLLAPGPVSASVEVGCLSLLKTDLFWQGQKLNLPQSTLDHIFSGEFTTRALSVEGSQETVEIWTSGLHAVDAVRSFLQRREDIRPFWDMIPGLNGGSDNIDKDYTRYFVFRGDNGVMYIGFDRPEKVFSRKALRATEKSETNYMAGARAWKVLFPSSFSQKNLIHGVQQALGNSILKDKTTNGGYYLQGTFKWQEGDKYVHLQIQISVDKSHNIVSVFPTWAQPQISGFYHPADLLQGPPNTFVHDISTQSESARDLNSARMELRDSYHRSKTPSILLSRPNKGSKPLSVGVKERWKQQKYIYGKNMSASQKGEIIDYLGEHPFVYYPTSISEISKGPQVGLTNTDPILTNKPQFYQNTLDALDILFAYDLVNGSRHSVDLAARIVRLRVVTDGIEEAAEAIRLMNRLALYLMGVIPNDSLEIFLLALDTTVGQLAATHDFINYSKIAEQQSGYLADVADGRKINDLDESLLVFLIQSFSPYVRPSERVRAGRNLLKVLVDAKVSKLFSYYNSDEFVPVVELLRRIHLKAISQPGASFLEGRVSSPAFHKYLYRLLGRTFLSGGINRALLDGDQKRNRLGTINFTNVYAANLMTRPYTLLRVAVGIFHSLGNDPLVEKYEKKTERYLEALASRWKIYARTRFGGQDVASDPKKLVEHLKHEFDESVIDGKWVIDRVIEEMIKYY